MQTSDTIAAPGTASGGAVGIIRISGPDAVAVCARVWRGVRPLAVVPPRTLELGRIADAAGAALDRALAVRFAAPESYTGEEMAELHCHGSRLILSRTLALLSAAGARMANPGEFTQRAFLNGKMDLTQAEAVADLIAAHSDRALRLANRHLAGAFGRMADGLYRRAEHLLAEAEARLDFPEEDLTLTPPETLCAEAAAFASELEKLLAGRRQGEILRHGIRVVIAGPPNAGKSSLLNAILGRDRAIVTHLPGTTRDTLEEWVDILGIPACVVDTAGIRETSDEIEAVGIRRTHEARSAADVEIWLMDAAQVEIRNWKLAMETEKSAAGLVIPVFNKIDLLPPIVLDAETRIIHSEFGNEASPTQGSGYPNTKIVIEDSSDPRVGVCHPNRNQKSKILHPVALSAKTGAGLDELFRRIADAVLPGAPEDAEVAVNGRHAALLSAAMEAVAEAATEMQAGRWELAAVAWRGALDALGRITGRTHTPDILDNIFSRFCIGK